MCLNAALAAIWFLAYNVIPIVGAAGIVSMPLSQQYGFWPVIIAEFREDESDVSMPLSQQYGFWPSKFLNKQKDGTVSMPLSQQYGFWLRIPPGYKLERECLNAALAAIWFLAAIQIAEEGDIPESQCRSRSNMVSGNISLPTY